MNEGSSKLNIEDILEDLDLKLKHKDLKDEYLKGKEGKPSAKAVKADDSKVPVHLWNDHVALKFMDHWKATGSISKKGNLENTKDCQSLNLVCNVLWQLMLKYWKKKVKKDFFSLYEEKGKHHMNHKAVLVA